MSFFPIGNYFFIGGLSGCAPGFPDAKLLLYNELYVRLMALIGKEG